MSCESCHTCGTPVRIVLDGEDWCDTCQTHQRPAHHGWGRRHDQTDFERLSCEEAKQQCLQHHLARLKQTSPELRFHLIVSDTHDGNQERTRHHLNLDAASLLPLPCLALYRGSACQVLKHHPTASTHA